MKKPNFLERMGLAILAFSDGAWSDRYVPGQSTDLAAFTSPNKLEGPDSNVEQAGEIKTIIVHKKEIGSTGSLNYAGYPYEEYLQELRGRKGADIFDKMRRSDTQVKTVLTAVKNPIRQADWSVDPAPEQEFADQTTAQEDAELIKQILFRDIETGWKQFVNEALTLLEFGYVVFEVTNKIVTDHPRFGTYSSLRSMGFRSQRTIERWNLDRETGKLVSVAQYAFGDLMRLVDIPGEFLLVVTLEKEGSNYEGISALRPCYGGWVRKNMFQKLKAIGVEKYAVPTPIVEVPQGKGDSTELAHLEEVLAAWTAHESAYITVPAGWKITLQGNEFDPEKIQKVIDAEDRGMAKSFLANFLELGMNTSGAYSLSNDLSDFFLNGIQYVAGLVCEEINQKLIPSLIKLNRGDRPAYPRLKATNIADKAGEEFAKMMKDLADSKVIIPDDELEEEIRKRLKLRPKSDKGQRFGGQVDSGVPEAAVGGSGAGAPKDQGFQNVQHAERRRPGALLLAERPRDLMSSGKTELKAVMQDGLRTIGSDLIRQIMGKVRRLPESEQLDAIKSLALKGTGDYRDALTECLTGIAHRALAQARSEVPRKRSVKLGELTTQGRKHIAEDNFALPAERKYPIHDLEHARNALARAAGKPEESEVKRAVYRRWPSLDPKNKKLAEFMLADDELPPSVKKRIQAQVGLLVDTQTSDLEKAAYFQFTHSIDSTDSDSLIEKDLADSVENFIDGQSVDAGAGAVTPLIVNSARNAFFFDDEVKSEIQSMTFAGGSGCCDLCDDLVGTVFNPDDPEAARYFPPLHHNCNHYLVPNLVGGPNKEIEDLKPSDPKLDKYMTLSERERGCGCGR